MGWRWWVVWIVAFGGQPAIGQTTISGDGYSIDYDHTTGFGAPTIQVSATGWVTALWSLPGTSAQAAGAAETLETNFSFPSVSVAPTPGYLISSPRIDLPGGIVLEEFWGPNNGSSRTSSAEVLGPIAFNLMLTRADGTPLLMDHLAFDPLFRMPQWTGEGTYTMVSLMPWSGPDGPFSQVVVGSPLVWLQAISMAEQAWARAGTQGLQFAVSFQLSPVPEPGAMLLLAVGLAVVARTARRRKTTASV